MGKQRALDQNTADMLACSHVGGERKWKERRGEEVSIYCRRKTDCYAKEFEERNTAEYRRSSTVKNAAERFWWKPTEWRLDGEVILGRRGFHHV
jgi:hypothetical protein